MSRQRPAISAIVPCFNAGRLLERTLDSLLSQTLPPREILVIDDASTSSDTQAALEVAESIPTVTVLRQPSNLGVAKARNRGLNACSGDFAVFLDADDLLTKPSLEAFYSALCKTSAASFAYPTVTCFGNRTDTFRAPDFNAYLLHHVNICPIAAMVTRSAIECGVRFDPALSIGHEDWDYWLRLTAEGFLGCPAPEAELLYRRVGFTRNDLGNQLPGGFEQLLRRTRQPLFAGPRLAEIKRQSAPGISLVTDHPVRTAHRLAQQTAMDAEVLDWANCRTARGRLVAFEWKAEADDVLSDPFVIEDLLSMGAFLANDQLIVSLQQSAVRAGTTSGIPTADDLHRGYVGPEDIAAVVVPAAWAQALPSNREAVQCVLTSVLQSTFVTAAHRIVWRAPQATSFAASHDSDGGAPSHQGNDRAEGWTRDVLHGLAPASPWRIAAPEGFFGPGGPSALRTTHWVMDPFGGTSLYGTDEELLVGSRILEPGPPLWRSATCGGRALNRVEDKATHQRFVAVGSAPAGTILQEVVGFVDEQPVPGTHPLSAAGPKRNRSSATGWSLTSRRGSGTTWPHPSDILFESRALWRAWDPGISGYEYHFSPVRLKNRGLSVDGRVMVLAAGNSVFESPIPIYAVAGPHGSIIGLSGRAHDGASAVPVGHLEARPKSDFDLIVSVSSEGQSGGWCGPASHLPAEYKGLEWEELGFSPRC